MLWIGMAGPLSSPKSVGSWNTAGAIDAGTLEERLSIGYRHYGDSEARMDRSIGNAGDQPDGER